MNEIDRELLMLRSGILGPEVDLQSMVNDGNLSKETAKLFLKELGTFISIYKRKDI